MERIKTVVRICRALAKKPQLRNSIDISYIAAETEGLALMTKDGPGVHKDLCHVAKVTSLNEMQSFRLPGDFKGGSVYAFVSTSRAASMLVLACAVD